jgi:hypothetical protein
VLDTQWQAQFEALQRFQKQHGHFFVTNEHQTEYPGLELWVLNQRVLRKRGQMDGERHQQLDAIGFIWELSDARWQALLVALQRFRKQHGHCLVTTKHEAEYPRLYRWVVHQHQRRGRGEMDDDQIKRLDAIGFFWERPQQRRKTTLKTTTVTTS